MAKKDTKFKDVKMRLLDKRNMLMSLKDEAETMKALHNKKKWTRTEINCKIFCDYVDNKAKKERFMQKVVLEKGITGGIGQAILNELAYQGDYLVAGLYCKNKEQAQALSGKYNADILQADITKYEDIVRCVDKIIANYR